MAYNWNLGPFSINLPKFEIGFEIRGNNLNIQDWVVYGLAAIGFSMLMRRMYGIKRSIRDAVSAERT